MSLPRPTEPYHFQANLIWWDSPFKSILRFALLKWDLVQLLQHAMALNTQTSGIISYVFNDSVKRFLTAFTLDPE
jgi:hypothetical protein